MDGRTERMETLKDGNTGKRYKIIHCHLHVHQQSIREGQDGSCGSLRYGEQALLDRISDNMLFNKLCHYKDTVKKEECWGGENTKDESGPTEAEELA